MPPESTPTLRELRQAIPRELFTPNDARAVSFLVRVVVLLAVCEAAAWWVTQSQLWWLAPLNWLATGTIFFGLFEVAHNCGHHAYFSSRRANRIVGHFAALPLLYPFTQWKLWHDAHHRRPNTTDQTIYEQFAGEMTLRRDTAFAPLSIESVERARSKSVLSWWVYRASRALTPVAVFLAPVLLTARFARELRPQDLRACRTSLAFTAVMVPACMYGVWWLTGSWQGIVNLWIGPLAVYAAWLGYYALLQHTGESIPVFEDGEWTTQAQFLAVVNTRTPRLISWLHGGGEFHCVHHIAPTLPNYHLRAANEAIRASEHGRWVRDVPFSLAYFWRVQRTCHVWDPETRSYRTFSSLEPR